jgi:glucokinase
VANGPVLGLDIGGTKLAAAVVDDTGRILQSARMDTPKGALVDAETVWRSLMAVVGQLAAGGGRVRGVGVGCGGPMVWPVAEVSPLGIPSWRGFPLGKLLEEEFPGLPVRVHNDAVCLTVGEHWKGAARSSSNVLGMVISTGVGGGLILGGRLIDGASGNAGHVGHIVVDPDGPDCACGGSGCLESIASASRLVAWAAAQGWSSARGVTARELSADAARGHPVARAAMARAGAALGRGIASATHLCDLEVVTVGGGLSQAGPLIFDPLEETFRRHVRLSFAREVRVVPVELGQEAGLVGAAALVLAGDRYWSGG